MKLELKQTADGSSTFFLPDLNEQYHSMNGAVTESEHVFLEMGFHYHPSRNPVVFEVGFGTGLNALLTASQAEISKKEVYYIAIEKHPLEFELIEKLDYGRFIPENGKKWFAAIHQCAWNVPVEISPYFRLLKLKSDFIQDNWALPEQCDVIYFDAFGPEKQPDMWTQQIFNRLFMWLRPAGVLVTYSAKGEVRRRMKAAGFTMEKLPGPPGKKEMLRGIK